MKAMSHWRWIGALGVIAVITALGFSGLGRLSRGASQPVGQLTSRVEPAAEAEDTPGPLVSLAINGTAEVDAVRGWPLVAVVGVMHPFAMRPGVTSPIVLTRQGGTWSEALRLVVTNDRGQVVAWPFSAAAAASPTIALDGQTVGEMVWWLAPEESARLALGAHQVVAVLEIPAAAEGGWTGRRRTDAVSVRVIDEPNLLSAQQEVEKRQRFTEYHLRRGDRQQAIGEVDKLLARQPKNVWALKTKGDWHAAAGRNREALALYDDALAAFYAEHPGPREPPDELLWEQRAVMTRLLQGQQGRQP